MDRTKRDSIYAGGPRLIERGTGWLNAAQNREKKNEVPVNKLKQNKGQRNV